MICKNCGNETADDMKFCPKCGASVVPETPVAQAPPVRQKAEAPQDDAFQPAKKSGKGGLYIVIAVLGVLLLSVIGLLVHREAAGRWLWEPEQVSVADKNEQDLPETVLQQHVSVTDKNETDTPETTLHQHIYEESTRTEPTCDKPGSIQKICRGCGDTVTEEIEPLGHSWIAATCTKAKTCERCGETSGNALGHNYTSTVIAPTPDAQGYTVHTCVRCGDSYKDQYVEYAFGVWRQYDGSLRPDDYPTLTLNDDYSSHFKANLLAGMGNITGAYTINGNTITCYVSYRDFSGFRGDTLTELVFRINGSELIYESDYLGWTEPGASFKK